MCICCEGEYFGNCQTNEWIFIALTITAIIVMIAAWWMGAGGGCRT